MDPEFLDTDAEHEHDSRVTSVSSKFEGELNVNKLEGWIGRLMQDKATIYSDTRFLQCGNESEIRVPRCSYAIWRCF